MTLKKKQTILMVSVLLAVLVGAFVLDLALPSYHIAVKVAKKGAV